MDYRTDNNPTGINFILAELGDSAPDYLSIKTASETDDKPTHLALATTYPCGDARQTWMSYAYLKTASHNLSESTTDFAATILRKRAEAYGNIDDLCEIDMLLTNSHEKAAALNKSDTRYALTIKKAGVEDKNLYPVNTAVQVAKSAAALNNAVNMPIEWYRKAATTIMDAAEELGVLRDELPAKIVQHGVRREPNFKTAAEVAAHRATKVGDVDIANLYLEIVKSAAADTPESVERYVDLTIELDRANGINTYGKGVVDPYLAFYSGPETSYVEKMASENVVMMDTMIPNETFNNMSAYIGDVFSKKATENLQNMIKSAKSAAELSEQIGKLPLNTQRQLMKLAVKKG